MFTTTKVFHADPAWEQCLLAGDPAGLPPSEAEKARAWAASLPGPIVGLSEAKAPSRAADSALRGYVVRYRQPGGPVAGLLLSRAKDDLARANDKARAAEEARDKAALRGRDADRRKSDLVARYLAASRERNRAVLSLNEAPKGEELQRIAALEKNQKAAKLAVRADSERWDKADAERQETEAALAQARLDVRRAQWALAQRAGEHDVAYRLDNAPILSAFDRAAIGSAPDSLRAGLPDALHALTGLLWEDQPVAETASPKATFRLLCSDGTAIRCRVIGEGDEATLKFHLESPDRGVRGKARFAAVNDPNSVAWFLVLRLLDDYTAFYAEMSAADERRRTRQENAKPSAVARPVSLEETQNRSTKSLRENRNPSN